MSWEAWGNRLPRAWNLGGSLKRKIRESQLWDLWNLKSKEGKLDNTWKRKEGWKLEPRIRQDEAPTIEISIRMLYVYKCEITISRRRSREEKKNNKVSTRTNKRASHTIYLTTWQGVRESEQRLDSQGVQTVCPFTTRGLCDDGLPLESRAHAARVTHSVQNFSYWVL